MSVLSPHSAAALPGQRDIPSTCLASKPGLRSPRGEIVIATVARPEGDTGVHVHTRTLREGVCAAGLPCVVQSPFTGSLKWLPVFAIRPALLHPVNKSWSTLWYRHWHLLALRGNLMRHLRRRPAAVVVAQCPLSARAAMDVRARLGASFPVTLVCHFNHSEAQEYRDKGELSDDRGYQAVLDFEKDVLQAVDQVVYVSDWARSVVEQKRGIRPRRSAVIYNGIAAAPPGSVTRTALGLSTGDLVLINVGTLEPRKNQVGLIDLFAAVARRCPHARLLLVGEGPSRWQLERKIREQGLASKVMLLGMRKDVSALLSVADLYVHYATLENCPTVLLEAARASLPAAAVPAGGVPGLQSRLGGVALDPADVTASLRALAPLLDDPALRAEAGRHARMAFERNFTRDAMTSAYLEALDLCSLRD